MVERSEISTCKTPVELVDAAAFVTEWWENAEGRRLLGEIGWLIDTGVVSEVVTSSARGQFVLEKYPIRWDAFRLASWVMRWASSETVTLGGR